MSFITQGKTNWKYILTVVILTAIIGGGILAWQYWWAPKEEAKMPEIKPPAQVLEDKTTDWKTYRNEKYGFEMRYPREWSSEGVDKTEKYSLSYNLFTVSLRAKDDFTTPIWIDIYDIIEGISLENVEKEIIHISDTDGYKWTEDYTVDPMAVEGSIFERVTTVRLIKVDKVFDIHYGKVYTQKSYDDIFNQILSTFRFLE